MSINNNTPSIRFSGFGGDWVEKKLGDIANFSKGSGYSKSDLRSSGHPIILYGRLYTKYQTVISEVDTFVNESKNSVKSQGNEVVVPASGETAEDIARASAVKQKGIILGGDLNVVGLSDAYNSVFTALKISNGQSKSVLSKKAQGKSVVHIRNSDLQSLLLNFPNLEEQTTIGNFFQHIDETIALSRSKHKKTKTLKKSFLNKMFPQAGKSQPEIRLKGFSGDWVKKMLVDEVDFFTGLTYSPSDVTDKTGTLVLRSSNVQGGEISLKDNVYVSSEVVNSQNVEPGDVIVVVRNGSRNLIGKHAMIKEPMANTVIGAFMTGIRAPIPSFLNALLDTQQFSDEISKNLGATINQITGGMFKSMEFHFPQAEEQIAIGQSFKKIDDTLALQAKQLKTLESLKKALLAKMFV